MLDCLCTNDLMDPKLEKMLFQFFKQCIEKETETDDKFFEEANSETDYDPLPDYDS